MTHFTNLQLESLALLVLFFLLFVYKTMRLWQQLRTKSLLRKNRTLKKLKALSWDDFELLCMELFANMGWKVLGNNKKGADGGVDIWMQKSAFGTKTRTALVQCKRYDDAMVTIKIIREMYGLMFEHDADEVYVVTTSRFTKECYTFIKEKKMTLIDGEHLVALIRKQS